MYTKILAIILATLPFMLMAAQNSSAQGVKHSFVSIDQLKNWYDQNEPMTVLDARTKPYFDGTLLPNAKWLSAEAPNEKILNTLPSKNSLIVVYCWSVDCPASGWLYDKLVKLGYTNVYEYHEGLQEWMKKGLPTTKQA